MKRIFTTKYAAALLGMLLVFGVADTFAQKKPVLRKKPIARKKVIPAVPLFTVERGTVIRSRMNQSLSSKTAFVGNTFTATVTEPVYSSTGVVVIPTGSIVTGRVNTVKPAAKGGIPGEISVSFTSVRLPNGRRRVINGSLTDLTSGKTTSDNESTASGKKMENRKLIFIGGGAAGGAILGAIVGGGKATAIGAILGAGGGFLGEKYMKGPEADVKSGTEFGINLNQSVALPRFAEAASPVNQ